MGEKMLTYWPFAAVCMIGVAFVIALVMYARSPRTGGELKLRWHYVLLWPLLIDWLQKDPKRAGVLFTKRELIGWGIVVLLVVVAIIVNPARGS